jgi:hypothetical protein
MNAQPMPRLASEDVIINAPMSYVGSAQRIMRLRRRANPGAELTAITTLAVILVVVAWAAVTLWYLIWGIWLVPYRLLRRGARKRRAEMLRHRELMGTIQGSAAGSASAIVTAMVGSGSPALAQLPPPGQRIGDAERDGAMSDLRVLLLAGRLTPEEFEERLGLTQAAKTRGDLELVWGDLPELPEAQQSGAA